MGVKARKICILTVMAPFTADAAVFSALHGAGPGLELAFYAGAGVPWRGDCEHNTHVAAAPTQTPQGNAKMKAAVRGRQQGEQ